MISSFVIRIAIIKYLRNKSNVVCSLWLNDQHQLGYFREFSYESTLWLKKKKNFNRNRILLYFFQKDTRTSKNKVLLFFLKLLYAPFSLCVFEIWWQFRTAGFIRHRSLKPRAPKRKGTIARKNRESLADEINTAGVPSLFIVTSVTTLFR